MYTPTHSFAQICEHVDAFDLHPQWNPSMLVSMSSNISFFMHGPPGVGKYAHALHFLREVSPSRFTKVRPPMHIDMQVPMMTHYTNLPNQPFLFRVSDVHIEIDLEQLGDDPLAVWDMIFHQARPLFSFIMCLHVDKAPPILLERLYTYMLPQWPPNTHKNPRFIFIGENMSSNPFLSIPLSIHFIAFPRPTIATYLQCIRSLPPPSSEIEFDASFLSEMEVCDITNIQDLYLRAYAPIYNRAHHKDDPFGALCEKMFDCMLSPYSADTVYAFSIEDIRSILNEWAIHRICYEEGLWYVLGKCIAQSLITQAQTAILLELWGHSGPYTAPDENGGAEVYNYKRAEYMCAELIRAILNTKS